jgi:hypothetical protein
MIMAINETELRKNTAQGAIAATIKPPTIGPITRPMLPPSALRVRAADSSDLGTSPLKVGIIGVLIIVVPAPNANVSINSTVGVVRPTKVSIASRADMINKYAHAIRRIRFGAKRSDSIPEGNANRNIGNVLAVVTRETKKGSGARDVISHDAPTSYIAAPTEEKRDAVHNILYREDFKGLNPDAEICS